MSEQLRPNPRQRRPQMEAPAVRPGFLVIDKPLGVTSHDVVAIVRAVTGIKKVGHTGTLDPLASGVLPLALGPATRFIQFLDEQLKIYDADIALGRRTTTGDLEGDTIEEAPIPDLSNEAALLNVLAGFVGPRMQRPPAYSAVKVKGRPLYKYAREGEVPEVPARPIEIYDLRLLERSEGRLRVEIHCSRGTYARVLAEEIGAALGSAGTLAGLRRLRSGPFTLEHSLAMPTLAEMAAETPDWERAFRRGAGEERVQWLPREQVLRGLRAWTVPLIDALSHLPRVQVPSADRARVLVGGEPPPPPGGLQGRYALVEGDQVLAVAEAGSERRQILRTIQQPNKKRPGGRRR